jgi:hypothetical protein
VSSYSLAGAAGARVKGGARIAAGPLNAVVQRGERRFLERACATRSILVQDSAQSRFFEHSKRPRYVARFDQNHT